MAPEKCTQHDEIIGGLFTTINEMRIDIAEIKVAMLDIKEFKDLMHTVVFGNGETEGLTTKNNRVAAHVLLQWGLLGLILAYIIYVKTP